MYIREERRSDTPSSAALGESEPEDASGTARGERATCTGEASSLTRATESRAEPVTRPRPDNNVQGSHNSASVRRERQVLRGTTRGPALADGEPRDVHIRRASAPSAAPPSIRRPKVRVTWRNRNFQEGEVLRSGQVLPRSLAVPARRPVRLSTRTIGPHSCTAMVLHTQSLL